MQRKYKLILSLICLILTIIFVICGILLFNIVPDVDTTGYTNPKDAMVMTGSSVSFIISLFSLIGSFLFLFSAFSSKDYLDF